MSLKRAADIYLGDDYPRIGCRIEVLPSASGVGIKIYAPKDAARDNNHLPIESFAASGPFSAAIVIFDWLSGRAPRRGYRDYSL